MNRLPLICLEHSLQRSIHAHTHTVRKHRTEIRSKLLQNNRAQSTPNMRRKTPFAVCFVCVCASNAYDENVSLQGLSTRKFCRFFSHLLCLAFFAIHSSFSFFIVSVRQFFLLSEPELWHQYRVMWGWGYTSTSTLYGVYCRYII